MRKTIWIVLFLLALVTELIAIYINHGILKMISKPLLMPLLIIYFILETKKTPTSLKWWVILALIFSWIGDILLLFEANAKTYFLLGLASFLLAQLFYIVFFHNIRVRETIRGNALLLLLAVIYYSALTNILGPSLEKANLNLPVRIYGVVLSFMFMLSLHTLFSRNRKAGWLMAIGATLFVISDSTLAFNKFYSPINNGDLVVMFTYGLAQLLIVAGAVGYINSQLPNRITESTRV
jgi:uncharacterized membrane protein YhhN